MGLSSFLCRPSFLLLLCSRIPRIHPLQVSCLCFFSCQLAYPTFHCVFWFIRGPSVSHHPSLAHPDEACRASENLSSISELIVYSPNTFHQSFPAIIPPLIQLYIHCLVESYVLLLLCGLASSPSQYSGLAPSPRHIPPYFLFHTRVNPRYLFVRRPKNQGSVSQCPQAL